MNIGHCIHPTPPSAEYYHSPHVQSLFPLKKTAHHRIMFLAVEKVSQGIFDVTKSSPSL